MNAESRTSFISSAPTFPFFDSRSVRLVKPDSVGERGACRRSTGWRTSGASRVHSIASLETYGLRRSEAGNPSTALSAMRASVRGYGRSGGVQAQRARPPPEGAVQRPIERSSGRNRSGLSGGEIETQSSPVSSATRRPVIGDSDSPLRACPVASTRGRRRTGGRSRAGRRACTAAASPGRRPHRSRRWPGRAKQRGGWRRRGRG